LRIAALSELLDSLVANDNPTGESPLTNSKQVGGLVGPIVVAMLVPEFPLFQPKLYDAQIPPVIYLSGVLKFVAGWAVVRAPNVWAQNWTVLIALCGWFSLALGLVRMFAASQYRQPTQGASSMTFMVLKGLHLGVALTITFKAYSSNRGRIQLVVAPH
jgi:hypothetical protein